VSGLVRLLWRLRVDRHRRDALRQVNDQLVQQTQWSAATNEVVATPCAAGCTQAITEPEAQLPTKRHPIRGSPMDPQPIPPLAGDDVEGVFCWAV